MTGRRILTLDVLAGAYLNGRTPSHKAMLSHSCMDDAAKTLCGRIEADRLVDEYGAGNVDAEPSCPVCAKRDPRFNGKGK